MDSIPDDILLVIFRFLDMDDLCLGVRSVCHRWHDLSYSSVLWRSLDLREKGVSLTDDQFTCALGPLRHYIQRLDLSGCCRLSDYALKHHLVVCPQLRHLNLSGTNITFNSLLYLVHKYPKLHSLSIGNCVLLTECNLCEVYSHLGELRVFDDSFLRSDFESNDTEETEFKFLSKVVTNKHLEVVRLSSELFNDDLLETLCNTCTNLTELDISSCLDLSGRGVRDHIPKICSLKYLNLSGTSVNDKDLGKIILRKLAAIDLSECRYITDVGLAKVMENCPNISSLTLNRANAQFRYSPRETSAYNISEAFVDSFNGGNLVYLDIAFCPSVVSLITKCPNLKWLNISSNYSLTDDSIIAIASHCRELETVSMNMCLQVTPRSMRSLLKSCPLRRLLASTCHKLQYIDFPICPHIEYIDFSYCTQLIPSSLHSLAENCSSIRELHLSGCHLIDDASIIAVSKQCKRLEVIDLSSGSSIQTSQLTDRCLSSLGQNSALLRTVLMSRNPCISIRGISHLLQCPLLTHLEFQCSTKDVMNDINQLILSERHTCLIPDYQMSWTNMTIPFKFSKQKRCH